MRAALDILDQTDFEEGCDFTYEGEMQLDAALDAKLRARIMPNSRLTDSANVLVFSNTEVASAVKNSFKTVSKGIEVGPISDGHGQSLPHCYAVNYRAWPDQYLGAGGNSCSAIRVNFCSSLCHSDWQWPLFLDCFHGKI